jgi:hypothetical protein
MERQIQTPASAEQGAHAVITIHKIWHDVIKRQIIALLRGRIAANAGYCERGIYYPHDMANIVYYRCHVLH